MLATCSFVLIVHSLRYRLAFDSNDGDAVLPLRPVLRPRRLGASALASCSREHHQRYQRPRSMAKEDATRSHTRCRVRGQQVQAASTCSSGATKQRGRQRVREIAAGEVDARGQVLAHYTLLLHATAHSPSRCLACFNTLHSPSLLSAHVHRHHTIFMSAAHDAWRKETLVLKELSHKPQRLRTPRLTMATVRCRSRCRPALLLLRTAAIALVFASLGSLHGRVHGSSSVRWSLPLPTSTFVASLATNMLSRVLDRCCPHSSRRQCTTASRAMARSSRSTAANRD